MDSLLNWLSQTKVLWVSFVLTVLVSVAFVTLASQVNGHFLDEALTQAAALEALNGLSSDQKSFHFWVTALLDTLYPLVYGGFFAGMIARLAGSMRRWAVWPGFIGVDCDFVENIAQMLALSNDPSWLFLKDFVTPIKMGGIGISLLLIAVFGVLALRRRKSAQV